MFASTGPKEDPILTPSFCSYNLLLKVNAVFVQVSNISFFKVLFLKSELTVSKIEKLFSKYYMM